MIQFCWRYLWVVCLIGISPMHAQQSTPLWYSPYSQITEAAPLTLERPIVIAVIDDGFRLSHQWLQDFIYENKLEVPNNQLDDDGNGYVDDYQGWDISDQDTDPSLPLGRANTFYHGTFIAGTITHLLQQSFGEQATQYFKILPVKVLSDQARNTYLKDGYRGIAYAIQQKADIIVCAWNGGYLSTEEAQLLQSAKAKGITILASAGNFYTESAAPPAAHPAVFAVAAVDSNYQKLPKSNYGNFVDLAGPGQAIWGANSMDDQSGTFGGESSAAVAVVAATFAQLKAYKPDFAPAQLLQILKNTALPLDQYNASYAGKLGAGLPQTYAAIQDSKSELKAFQRQLPEGYLSNEQVPSKSQEHRWEIAPAGQYKGIWLNPNLPIDWPTQSQLLFYDQQERLVQSWSQQNAPGRIFIPGNSAQVVFKQNRKKQVPPFNIDYHVETVDSSQLYCSATQYFELPQGQFSDGSGLGNYTSNCDCKWQIMVPEGQRIRIRFSDFDTQAKVDFVYLFDGESPTTPNIIAKFSGPDIPPEVISRSNKVLVWFVTDSKERAKGWTLTYEAVK